MANTGMYVKLTKISEIRGGKVDFELRVRVINLWTTPDRSNPAEEGAIHMIFLDAANVMKETEKNGKINRVMDATLEDLEGNRIHCTLWDDFAAKMQQFLDNHDPSLPVIIILQLCKLKKYLGSMGISNSFYGSKLFLNAEIPEVAEYIERMNAANVELTQVVSQMTGPPIISLADDMLQTQRMTIEDLIEANERCYGSVLAWTCEFDTDAGWFYQACTKCASRINFVGGQLYCDKCKMPRTAVPRFKVHLQVIDDTGSITFVLFDRVVSQILGRTAQDLLDAMNNMFAGNNDDANYDDGICNLDTDALLDVVEGGDSTTNGGVLISDVAHTPTSKTKGKDVLYSDDIGASATKKTVFPIETIDLSDSDEPLPSKAAGKRSADPYEKDVTTPREIKIPCVKIESTK
ncbi:hypothetical protein TSUD_89950 [Trifolium subterraneum]|uniref:Replication factor A C-terminal domain-containing protein n=1 Tax=Trifolium subterraneum TaxID=3900 RepID=A0A2Z6PA73_TRISU|nr:hypothetical protein TSUD_89950 [Trifolium subterraneum]